MYFWSLYTVPHRLLRSYPPNFLELLARSAALSTNHGRRHLGLPTSHRNGKVKLLYCLLYRHGTAKHRVKDKQLPMRAPCTFPFVCKHRFERSVLRKCLFDDRKDDRISFIVRLSGCLESGPERVATRTTYRACFVDLCCVAFKPTEFLGSFTTRGILTIQ